MAHDFHEKRKDKRIAVKADYSLVIGNEEYVGVVANISLGGIYLQTFKPKFTEDMLRQHGLINLDLDGDKITLPCVIVYVGGYRIPVPEGVGVAFSDVSDEQLNQLKMFLERSS